MKVYIDNENYKLLQGDVLDCLQSIEDSTIDMIVTSPPYNIDLKNRKDTNIAKYDNWNDDLNWENIRCGKSKY